MYFEKGLRRTHGEFPSAPREIRIINDDIHSQLFLKRNARQIYIGWSYISLGISSGVLDYVNLPLSESPFFAEFFASHALTNLKINCLCWFLDDDRLLNAPGSSTKSCSRIFKETKLHIF
jgi:hypothetical protein